MKKIILLLTLISLTGFSFAQTIGVGIKGGLNLSSLSTTTSGYSVSSSNTTGFHVGGFVDIGFENWSIQPAVLFTTKGGESSVSGSVSSGSTSYSFAATEKVKLNYIEVPVNVLYHIPVAIGKIFIGGGPYVAYGISGTDKSTTTGTGSVSTSTSTDIKYGSGSSDFVKNPDFGLNALGGLRLENGLLVSVGYGFGLANLSNDSSGKIHNNGFSVSVGFSFL